MVSTRVFANTYRAIDCKGYIDTMFLTVSLFPHPYTYICAYMMKTNCPPVLASVLYSRANRIHDSIVAGERR